MPAVVSNPKLTLCEPELLAPDTLVSALPLPADTPFQSTVFTVPEGSQTPVDQHQVQELWVILNGEGELLFDGEYSKLQTGDITHFKSQQAHQIRNTGAAALTILSVYW